MSGTRACPTRPLPIRALMHSLGRGILQIGLQRYESEILYVKIQLQIQVSHACPIPQDSQAPVAYILLRRALTDLIRYSETFLGGCFWFHSPFSVISDEGLSGATELAASVAVSDNLKKIQPRCIRNNMPFRKKVSGANRTVADGAARSTPKVGRVAGGRGDTIVLINVPKE